MTMCNLPSKVLTCSSAVPLLRRTGILAHEAAHVLAYHTLERFALREVVVPAAESLMTLQGGLPAPEQLLLGPVAPGTCLTLAAALTAHWSDGCTLLLGELAARTANAALWSVYSRSCEAEADWCGYHISEAAGYDPDGATLLHLPNTCTSLNEHVLLGSCCSLKDLHYAMKITSLCSRCSSL